MNLIKLTVSLLISIIVLGCTETKEDWETEEVLVQLQEIKKELKEIKTQIAELETSGGGVRKAATLDLPNFYLGSNDAKFAVLEFADFECPYCARHHNQTLPEIKKEYVDTGKIRYYVRDYPLSFHRNAVSAAVAARCSGKQGKYWEMHHELFVNSRKLGKELYMAKAGELSLNQESFEACLSDKSVEKLVNMDMTLGNKAGVNGTPRFFIGRIKGKQLVDVVPLSGAQPFRAFSGAIDSLLTK